MWTHARWLAWTAAVVSIIAAVILREEPRADQTKEVLDRACPMQLCITLRESSARRALIRREFRRHTPPRFVVVDRDHEDPGRGCYASHVACMRLALGQGASAALVFEDDVRFADASGVPPEAWTEAAEFVRTRPFDILLLGWGDGDCYREDACEALRDVPGFAYVKEGRRLCAHAVVYSRDFMHRFVERHDARGYPGFEIDDQFVVWPGVRMFVLEPELFVQAGDLPSTIDDESVPRVYFPPRS